jgi:ABC-2 type transport system ATP-binding protein
VSDKVIFLKHGQYKNNENGLISDNQLIIEIDTSNSREDLLETFKNFKLEKLNFNGGVFVAYFAEETELYQVILALGNAKIQITYLRNISNSTRRFFVH